MRPYLRIGALGLVILVTLASVYAGAIGMGLWFIFLGRE